MTLTAVSFTYAYPHPALTTDVVLFTVRGQRLELLLVRRGREPYAGSWAFPGGFVDIDEDLEPCARRELEEETGLRDVYLEQLCTVGTPGRDPRERVVSVVYLGLAPAAALSGARAGDDAAEVGWFGWPELPPLAFDHPRIAEQAYQRLSAKLAYSTLALQLLPECFTLGELQQVYEAVLGTRLDKRNFRKRLQALDCVVQTGERARSGHHRPAMLYRARRPGHVDIVR